MLDTSDRAPSSLLCLLLASLALLRLRLRDSVGELVRDRILPRLPQLLLMPPTHGLACAGGGRRCALISVMVRRLATSPLLLPGSLPCCGSERLLLSSSHCGISLPLWLCGVRTSVLLPLCLPPPRPAPAGLRLSRFTRSAALVVPAVQMSRIGFRVGRQPCLVGKLAWMSWCCGGLWLENRLRI